MAKSLRVQIKEAEQQVLRRQHDLALNLVTLTNKIHQQLTAPATLLLTSGVGFIIGEMTKRQTCKANDGQVTKQSSPIITAMSLINSMRTIYLVLPVAWMLKQRQQNPEQLKAGCDAAGRKFK